LVTLSASKMKRYIRIYIMKIHAMQNVESTIEMDGSDRTTRKQSLLNYQIEFTCTIYILKMYSEEFRNFRSTRMYGSILKLFTNLNF